MKTAKEEKLMRLLHRCLLVCTILALAAVFYLTAQSGTDTLKTQALAEKYLPFLFPKHEHSRIWLRLHLNSARRLAHIYEFAVLGALLAALFRTGQKLRGGSGALSWPVTGYAAAFWVSALFSILDQTHKIFVPFRHFDPLDLVLDAIGYGSAVGGLFFLHLLVQGASWLVFRAQVRAAVAAQRTVQEFQS